MKNLLLFLLLAASAFAQSSAPQPDHTAGQRERKMRNIKQSPAEHDAIKAQVDAMAKAWNDGNLPGMTAYMGTQVRVVTALGKSIHGRKDVETHQTDLMKTHFAGSRESVNVRDIFFVRPRVAICDVEETITRYKSLPPGVPVKAGQPLRLLTRYVLTKDGRDWTVAAVQSTILREAAGK